MATNVTMTSDQLNQLVTHITTAAIQAAATAKASDEPTRNAMGSFAMATFSFDGTRSQNAVEEFISSLKNYTISPTKMPS